MREGSFELPDGRDADDDVLLLPFRLVTVLPLITLVPPTVRLELLCVSVLSRCEVPTDKGGGVGVLVTPTVLVTLPGNTAKEEDGDATADAGDPLLTLLLLLLFPAPCTADVAGGNPPLGGAVLVGVGTSPSYDSETFVDVNCGTAGTGPELAACVFTLK